MFAPAYCSSAGACSLLNQLFDGERQQGYTQTKFYYIDSRPDKCVYNSLHTHLATIRKASLSNSLYQKKNTYNKSHPDGRIPQTNQHKWVVRISRHLKNTQSIPKVLVDNGFVLWTLFHQQRTSHIRWKVSVPMHLGVNKNFH